MLYRIADVRAGFEKPSAIQQRSIVPILGKRDVIAQVRCLSRSALPVCVHDQALVLTNYTRVQAQSGTGKTSTLAIIGLQVCDVHKREVQVLILSPTREIATQLESTMNLLGAHMSLLVHCCIGASVCVLGVFLCVCHVPSVVVHVAY